MSQTSIYDALNAQFQTVPNIDTNQIAWENVAFTPTIGTTWWQPFMSAITRDPSGAGAKGTVKWSGNYQISVRVPISVGAAVANGHLDDIFATFARGTTLTTSDNWTVHLEVPMPRPGISEQNWYQGIAICPWFAYELPT